MEGKIYVNQDDAVSDLQLTNKEPICFMFSS